MNLKDLLARAQGGDEEARGQLRTMLPARVDVLRVRADTLDVEARTCRTVMATEAPTPQIDWDRWEIIPEVLRMSGMQSPAQIPFLDAHQRCSIDEVLGSVRQIEAVGDVAEGTIHFAQGVEEAEMAWALVRDGHLTDVSVGYEVTAKTYVKAGETVTVEGKSYTGPVNVATTWKLKELSLVPIGADPNAKLRAELETLLTNKPPTPTRQEPTVTVETENPPPVSAETVREQERARINEIDALCGKFNIPAEKRAEWIGKDCSVAEVRGLVLDIQLERNSKTQPAASLGDGFAPDLSDKERQQYSLMKGIRAAVDGNWKEAGLELEVSNDIAKRMGKAPGKDGFFAPTNIPWYQPRNARSFDYAVGTAGAGTTGGTLVATNLLAGSFIEVLRNRARVLQAGATVLSGLIGNVDLPRQTGASAATWGGETTDANQTAATFDKIAFSMKTLGARSLITRNMLMQSTPDIEMLVRADLIAQMALGIDAAALYGSGSGSTPRGIANTVGIGSVVGGTNGAAITMDHIIDLETQLTDSNAPEETLAYLANGRTIGALKKLKSTTGQYLWTPYTNGMRGGTPPEINGYPIHRTNQLRKTLTKGSASGVCSELVFGAWSELILAEWGVLEILPNPYDPAVYDSGGIILRALQSADIGIRHAVSFSYMSDALTS